MVRKGQSDQKDPSARSLLWVPLVLRRRVRRLARLAPYRPAILLVLSDQMALSGLSGRLVPLDQCHLCSPAVLYRLAFLLDLSGRRCLMVP